MLLITSGMILTLYDCVNKFYSCYMAIVVGIGNGHGPYIETKPLPIMLKSFTYYALEQCSKKLPITLNIMPATTAIMPQIIHNFITLNVILA